MITQYKAADPLDPTSQAEYKLLAGGATRTWVGTEDAYNAEKNNIPNNTMICITDDDMDVDTDVYSTTETKTNKIWIDNKPIYRKVVSLPATKRLNDVSYINLGITFPNDADTMFLPIVVNFYGDIMYYNSYKPIQAACKAEVDLESGTNFILEYTKTTD